MPPMKPMTSRPVVFGAGLFAAILIAAPIARARQDDAYSKVLADRAAKVLDALALNDPAKEATVREIVIRQYRSLRDLHDARDARLKQLSGDQREQSEQVKSEARTAVKNLREQFLSKLSAELTPRQIETVMDVMTYNKVKVTFDAYCAFLPDLTDTQKSRIMEWLKQAREEAIDGGSSEEKSAIFNKYKGKINNYLAAEGYDLKKGEQEYRERQKAARAAAAAATRPAN
jgi:hypothetical protein